MSKHTKEPWGSFEDGAHDGFACLNFEDYERARACVNACAGIPTEKLDERDYKDTKYYGRGRYAGVKYGKQQRDKLIELLKELRALDTILSIKYRKKIDKLIVECEAKDKND